MYYPKLDTLWLRDPETFRVREGEFRWPEFSLPSRWLVTEKIEGMNVQVRLRPDGIVTYGGRAGERSNLPANLVTWLIGNLPQDKVVAAFDPGLEAYLFGEGYGPGIQKGGQYRPTVSLRLFDIAVVGADRVWWLNWEGVEDVAKKLGVETVPVVVRDAPLSLAVAHAREARLSTVSGIEGGAPRMLAEGIVARTEPLLFTRRGDRVAWKLKVKDYTGGKKPGTPSQAVYYPDKKEVRFALPHRNRILGGLRLTPVEPASEGPPVPPGPSPPAGDP